MPQAQPNHDYIQPLQRPTSETSVDERVPGYTDASTQASGYSGSLANKNMAQHLVNSSQVINQSSKNYQQLMTPTQPINAVSSSAQQTAMMPGQWLQVSEKKILLKLKQEFYLLETAALHLSVMSRLYSDAMPVSQPLLMPISITATPSLLVQAKALYQP